MNAPQYCLVHTWLVLLNKAGERELRSILLVPITLKGKQYGHSYYPCFIFDIPNWIGHILHRNCLLKQVIEGKIKEEMEVARIRGRRKKLLYDLKDRRGYSHLKEEDLDRSMWGHRFGGGFGPVVRQSTE
jgi:hypothetical protein